MIFASDPPPHGPLRARIVAMARADETAVVEAMVPEGRLRPGEKDATEALAGNLVGAVRKARKRAEGLDTFLHEYGLSSPEGVVLMCLAEALLRIPDADTANRLIRDKLASAEWEAHLGQSDSVLVNASTWGLMLHGPCDCPRPRFGGQPSPVRRPAGGALGRAVDPPGAQSGDANPGRAIRDGPHHRRGAGAGRRRDEMALFLRHARRGRPYRRRRRALF